MARGIATDDAIVGRFELLERVGVGAFGEVYRGRDCETGEPVAIKRLHAHHDEAALVAERFAREARLLRQIDSPHVVRYLAHGRDGDGRPWLATEWLGGQDLARWRTQPGVTLRDALSAVRQLALGVGALHRAGVVHRDLKPANLIVTSAPSPPGASNGAAAGGGAGAFVAKVLDLGIAHVEGATVLTHTGMILGSPAYMAPEQVRGDPADTRADLWSLGVLLFELCAGDTPFGSTNAIATLGKVLLEPVPALDAVRQGLPPHLAWLVGRMLERAIERRLGSVDELVAALDAVLALPPEAHPLLDQPAPVAHAPTAESGGTHAAHAGERRLVALLFARGGGPEYAGDAAVAAAIARHGGRAERLRDAFLGGFGLSRARGDELVASARAACEACGTGARVALVAGWAEVRAGRVHAGQLIEQGAALLERASPGEARVAADAAAALEAQFVIEPPAPAPHPREAGEAGRADEALRLVRERRAGSLRPPGAPLLLLGREVPAVGREKEIRLLEGLVCEAREEHAARVAVVLGEPGVGKSRIRHELFARLGREQVGGAGGATLVLRGDPITADAPHAMVVNGLREAIGLEEGEGAEAARAKLATFAQRWTGGRVDAAVASALGEILHVGGASSAATSSASGAAPGALSLLASEPPPSPASRGPMRVDPALTRQRLREALAALLRGAAEDAGVLVLSLDDLHWADRATVDLAGWLHDELRDAPLVMLAFARPELAERHPSLWPGVGRTELRLAPLSQRASEQLVAAVLSVSDEERRAIAARAGGNPLFLEELVRARAAGVAELPLAVQAALQVRLDGLSVDARRLAQAASVFGTTFWTEGVAAVRSGNGTGAAALRELLRAELVVARPASRFAQCAEHAFRHALVRDAAYAMLVESDRREMHARAGAWLARAGERDAAVVAQHFELGARLADAAAWFTRAAEQALGESAYPEAERAATRALTCAGRVGPCAATALLLRAEARRALGRSDSMLADARAASELVGEDDPAALVAARSRVAEALHVLGQLDEADATLRAVLEESHASLLAARVHALLELALVDLDAGRGGEAGPLIDEALSWLADAGPEFEYARLRALDARVGAHLAVGDLGSALSAAQAALRACKDARHRARAAEARVSLARVQLALGRTDDARAELATAREEALALHAPHIDGQAQQLLGVALAAEERFDDAIARQDAAIALGEGIGARRIALGARTWRLLHRLARGHAGADAPAALVDEATALRAQVASYAPLRCVVDAALAQAHLRCGDAQPGALDAALAAADAAMRELRVLGTLGELEEFVRLAAVDVLDAAGRRDEADAAIYQARERLQRKAAKVRDPALRRAFVTAVADNRRLLELAQLRLGSKG